MIIKNKYESIEFIKKNHLNNFGEEVFKSTEIDKIKDYLNNHTEKYYLLKDKTRTNGKFYLNLTKEEVLQHVPEYKVLGLDVASYNYLDHKVLLGEIVLTKDMNLILSGSYHKDSHHRNFREPNVFLRTNLFDRKVKYVKGLDIVIDYIFKHYLFDMIIEFCVYDIPVGLNKEKIVIFEVRTEY